MEKLRDFSKYLLPKLLSFVIGCFFGLHCQALNTFCNLFVLFPKGFHYSGLQLFTKLKNSFRRFLLKLAMSQQKGYPRVSLNRMGISGCVCSKFYILIYFPLQQHTGKSDLVHWHIAYRISLFLLPVPVSWIPCRSMKEASEEAIW